MVLLSLGLPSFAVRWKLIHMFTIIECRKSLVALEGELFTIQIFLLSSNERNSSISGIANSFLFISWYSSKAFANPLVE